MTQTFAIIGHPIGHSISPAIYNATFPAMGIDARYDAWDVETVDVSGAIERLRGADMGGMNVTVPHKQAVLPLLDEVEATARAIGAVNCIAKDASGRLVGHNTDRYGFIRSLREAGCEPAGLRVVVLGVGGSARAVAFGLAQAGVDVIALAGRRPEPVAALAQDLSSHSVGAQIERLAWGSGAFEDACIDADLIVNCTPVGMRHTPSEGESPIESALLRPGVWVCDLVYNPLQTRLLRLAATVEARPVAGLEMLVYQAAEAVRLWTGREPPVDVMRAAAQRAMGL